jgi:hypothetical protein
MSRFRRIACLGGVAAVAAAGVVQLGSAGASVEVQNLRMDVSSDQLAACMPKARVTVQVRQTTDAIGFDLFHVEARGLAPNTPFTVFLLEQATPNFGAAEYIGDFTTDSKGNGFNTFRLIVSEAFASTIVDGARVRVDLNRVGMWFADQADDDFCLGPDSPVTPFDGDNEAGVQALNSRNADPLPAP